MKSQVEDLKTTLKINKDLFFKNINQDKNNEDTLLSQMRAENARISRKIDEMFEEFRKGESHLAFVTEVQQGIDTDPYLLCVGIVTLEDILEELVQMEIYDEFDDKKESKNI